MPGEKFTLMQYSVNAILGLIEANDFVIPEIQRPFVWKRSQVRDLIDSLYHGYPTGYIITWKNPSVRTKDGGYSQGKKVLIDGQQRITALMAAISGKEVLDEDFKKDRIKIAFNPLAADDSKRFAVQDASHLKDKKWIPDISVLFSANFKPRAFENEYAKNNPNVDLDELAEEISKLTGIANRQIGVIELDHSLDIDEVTEIFIRINSKGTALSQSDFVMSKMAADTDHDGSIMRKAVDYFCHLAVKPEFYENLKKDTEFQQSIFADKIKWLAKDYDDIYDPGYSDMLRVSFMHQFRRGKLADLVSLLSGRDFETKEFREDIVSDSYQKLEHGILNFQHFNAGPLNQLIDPVSEVSKGILTFIDNFCPAFKRICGKRLQLRLNSLPIPSDALKMPKGRHRDCCHGESFFCKSHLKNRLCLFDLIKIHRKRRAAVANTVTARHLLSDVQMTQSKIVKRRQKVRRHLAETAHIKITFSA